MVLSTVSLFLKARPEMPSPRQLSPFLLLLLSALLFSGCARPPSATMQSTGRMMETTAYCGESGCGDWERGSYKYLKLDFWNRYQTKGPNAGKLYSGLTAHGTKPHEPTEWLFVRDGTIAADTRYYPFGTRMYVPGYGWGTVEDRGGAIKGPDRLDLYFDSLEQAKQWGRRRVKVYIEHP